MRKGGGGTRFRNALRFALRIISGNIIYNFAILKICGFSRIAFSQEGSVTVNGIW